MKRKEEPNREKDKPTAPFVLIAVTGLVANVAIFTAKNITKTTAMENCFFGQTKVKVVEKHHIPLCVT